MQYFRYLLVAETEGDGLGDTGEGEGLHVNAVLLHVGQAKFGVGILVRIGILPRFPFASIGAFDPFTDGP